MTSSVRPPLATTVCGGSTCKLFRPSEGDSPADCSPSARISSEHVQQIGSADSNDSVRDRDRSRSAAVRAAIRFAGTDDRHASFLLRATCVDTRSFPRPSNNSPPRSVDNFSTSGNLPEPGISPTNRIRDTHPYPVSGPEKFISHLRLTTRPVSVASPPLSVCFRTRLPGAVLPSVQQSLHTGFPASDLFSRLPQVGC